MRRTTSSLAVVTAFAMTACMNRQQEPTPQPQPTATAGMEQPIEDAEAMEERARITREQAVQPPPQYGQRDTEPMEPPTYDEMQREPGEMEPQYGMTQPPLGGETPPPSYGEMPMGETGDMSARIQETLRTVPSLEDDAISVRVEGSRVYLAGLVDSPTEVTQARDLVSSIPGVEDVVVEELTVVTDR